MRRAIAPVLEGARLESVEIRDPRLVRPFDPSIVADALVGERVGEVGRRGKYLIVGFESGRSLLIHLRMTGSLRHAPSGALADDPYTRAVLRLDNGSDVAYRDVRRFGTWELFEPDELAPYLAARLGPEPLGPFSAAQARQAARGAAGAAQVGAARPANGRRPREHLRRRGALAEPAASAAGRGQPRRETSSARLYRAVRSVLRKGIERQGSTLRDYALPDGAYGTMQDEFRAYGRGGEPCDRCGRPLTGSSSAGARRRSARTARRCRDEPRRAMRRATSTS